MVLLTMTLPKIHIIIKLILSFLFISCEKLDLGDCFKNTGKIIIEERNVPDFEYIDLADNVNLIITQDVHCGIKVEADENIMGSIITDVQDKKLTIRNENTCDWVRNYNKDIDIYLSVAHLVNIYYKASGNIISTNTIVSDSLNIEVWDGSGSIDLDIATQKSVLSLHYGTVDFNIRGTSNVNYIYASSYGPFYCQDLITQFTFMNNRGSNDCYVY